MRKSHVLTTCAALIACTMAANATPSLFGPTGLVAMPTAETLAPGQVQISTNLLVSYMAASAPCTFNVGLPLGIEMGVSSTYSVAFGGLAAVEPDYSITLSDTTTIVNLKLAAVKETSVMPAVAIGALNVGGNEEFMRSTNTNSGADNKIDFYVVASKKLQRCESAAPITGHVGYIGGGVKRVMLGANVPISPKVGFMADWINGFSNFGFAAQYKVNKSVGIKAGWVNKYLTAGISYDFRIK